MLAVRAEHQSIGIYQLEPPLVTTPDEELVERRQISHKWVHAAAKVEFPPDGEGKPKPPVYFKLLDIRRKPALWCQGGDDDPFGILCEAGAKTKLEASSPLPRAADVDVTVAGDQLRVFWRQPDKRGDRFFQRRYSLEGKPDDEKPVELRLARGRDDNHLQWMAIAALALMAIFVLNVLLRRRAAARGQGPGAGSGDEDEE